MVNDRFHFGALQTEPERETYTYSQNFKKESNPTERDIVSDSINLVFD